jgi:hypothetical protein
MRRLCLWHWRYFSALTFCDTVWLLLGGFGGSTLKYVVETLVLTILLLTLRGIGYHLVIRGSIHIAHKAHKKINGPFHTLLPESSVIILVTSTNHLIYVQVVVHSRTSQQAPYSQCCTVPSVPSVHLSTTRLSDVLGKARGRLRGHIPGALTALHTSVDLVSS